MRLDNEDGDMPSNREGRCRECGAYWSINDRIYFRTGYPYYFCSNKCRELRLGIINNTAYPRERNATEGMPVQHVPQQQQEHHTITREERIEKMHKEKMDLLLRIAVAEEKRNELLIKKGADR